MYHMTPEQIRQRFLLIDQLDFYVPLALLIFMTFFLALTFLRARLWHRDNNKCDIGWWKVLDFVAYMVGMAAVGYYIWKTFFAFY
jgi:hypothetical protein